MAETGYSKGNLKPQAGSLSREFNPAHPCYFNVTDSESDYITVSFFGDVTADFEDRGLKIDGVEYPLDSASYDSEANRTTLSFLRGSFVYEDGETYEVDFAEVSPEPLPLPSWTVAPSISGTPQVGQTLTSNPGTVVNGTVTSRVWLRDSSPISGATGSTYTLVEADVDAMISFRPTATGPGGTASATSSAVGPIEDVNPEGRVIIDVNGAGTGLTVQNAAEFPGATWQWYTSNGTPISGQTTSTLLFTNLPEGAAVFLRANADSGTDSVKFIEPRDTTIVAFDAADEADGALAGRFPQITADAAGFFDDGALFTSAHSSFVTELGTTAQRVDVELLFGNPANSNESTSTERRIEMGYTNNSNRMVVSVRGGFIEFTKVGGGSAVWDIIPKVFGQNKDGDIFTIELEPGTGTELFLRVYRNGVRVEGSPGKGFNINSTGNVLTPGTKVRYEGPSNTGTANPSWPVPIMRTFKASAIVASPVVVQTVGFVAPTIEAPAQIEFSGTSETALVLEAMISAPNGETVVPFTEFALSETGAFSGLSLPLPESMHGAPSGYILRVRDKSDIDSYTDYILGPIPVFPPFFNTQWGFQANNVASWGDDDIYTDRGVITSWAAWIGDRWWGNVAGEVYPLKDNGTPNLLAVPGIVHAVAKIWESGMVGYGRGGLYEVKWQMEGVTASWINLANASGGTVDNVNKTATINIGEMDHVGAHLRFDWTVPPTQDWRVEVTRIGETATGPINDKVFQSFASNDFYRWMKTMKMEHPYTPTADGLSLISPLSAKPELIGAASTQTGVRPWICFPTNENDAWTTDFATRLKTTIAPGMMIELELGNELEWNYNYASSNAVLQTRALNVGGFLPGAPAGGWIWGQGYTENTNLAASTLKVPVAAGSRVILAGGNYQNAPVLAKNDLPIGHPIPDIRPSTYYEDADMIIYSTQGALLQAMREYQVVRTAQIKQIFQDVFDGDNEIRAYIGIQLGNNSFVNWLNAHPVEGKQIDGISPSHYTESNFRWEQAPAWFKNPADQETWLANFHTEQALGKIPGVISKLQANKNAFYTLLALGWAPEEIPYIVTYEGELHASLQDIPSEFRAGIKANLEAYKESDEYYEFIQLLMAEIDALGLYGACDFAMHGVPRSGSIIDNFGYMRAVNSYNHPVTGWKDKKWFARADYLASR